MAEKTDMLSQTYDKKISVLIPAYNAEKYLPKCLDSILAGTYKNLEIIVVNDGSTDGTQLIIDSYKNKDNRIKSVSHNENKGLFSTRITGLKCATGDYIGIVDSDDYISPDFYHLLLTTMLENNSDMVIADTVMDDNGYLKYYGRQRRDFSFTKLEKPELQHKFYGLQGHNYLWHTVWNKLYKKELWDIALPYLEKINSHLTFAEDIAYSSVLYYFADSISANLNAHYFYYRSEDSATINALSTAKSGRKTISDLNTVFDFVENFLTEIKADDEYRTNFHEWKKYYSRMWRQSVNTHFWGRKRKELLKEIDDFCQDERGIFTREDNYYMLVETPWHEKTEGEDIISHNLEKEESENILIRYADKPFLIRVVACFIYDRELFKRTTIDVLIQKNATKKLACYLRKKWGKG